jgi:undecaprenyl-diphosphatase
MNADSQVFFFVNRVCACPVIDLVIPLATFLGSGEFIFAVAVILIILARKSQGRLAGILLLAGLTVDYYAVYLLKNWVARPRPFMTLADVQLVGAAEKGFSFPSGHAAAVFMAAVVLSRYFKRPVIFFGLAALVAVSRVYSGVHYPTDVISGAALGAGLGYALVRVSE